MTRRQKPDDTGGSLPLQTRMIRDIERIAQLIGAKAEVYRHAPSR
jgi:hypothetical protein